MDSSQALSNLFTIRNEISNSINLEVPKAIAYCRISFKQDSDQNGETSIDHQKQLISDYCNNKGISLIESFCDYGKPANKNISGELLFDYDTGINRSSKKKFSRPALVEAISYVINNREINEFICTSPCRFSRNLCTAVAIINCLNHDNRFVKVTFTDLNKSFDSRCNTREIINDNFELSQMWISLQQASELLGRKIKNALALRRAKGEILSSRAIHGKVNVKKKAICSLTGKTIYVNRHSWSKETINILSYLKTLPSRTITHTKIQILNMKGLTINGKKWNINNFNNFINRCNRDNLDLIATKGIRKKTTLRRSARLSSTQSDIAEDESSQSIIADDESTQSIMNNIEALNLNNTEEEEQDNNTGDAGDYM